VRGTRAKVLPTQERQCTYDVTLRRVLARNKYRIICVRYPAYNAHVLYCHLWLALLCDILPDYLINGTLFENNIIEYKMWCDFLYKFCLKYV